MRRMLNPGPASVRGLRWLAGVGPAPLDAWGVAMGWGQTTAYSHASRLVSAGLIARCLTRYGSGALFYATRAGARESGIRTIAVAAAPAPTTWAHCDACAWTAAWLTSRGRPIRGSRELLTDTSWSGEVRWIERGGIRTRGHRPDLAAGLSPDSPLIPIEVELTAKSNARLRAILGLHATWIASRKTGSVIYVCATPKLASNVRREGAEVGLATENKTLRVELLETVREAAIAARASAQQVPANPTLRHTEVPR